MMIGRSPAGTRAQKLVLLGLLVIISVFMTAAAQPNQTPTAAITTVPTTPILTPVTTPTPIPTPTPLPSPSPTVTQVVTTVPPDDTPTPMPTVTQLPTQTALPTATPPPTATRTLQPTRTPNSTQNQTTVPTTVVTTYTLPPTSVILPTAPVTVETTATPVSPTPTPQSTPTAVLTINQSSFEEILADYNQQIAADPKNAKLWFRKGFFLQTNRMYESALTAFDNAIRIAPDYKEAVYNRGVSLEALGDTGGALEAYDQALLIDPDYAPAIAGRYKLLADNPGLGTLVPTPVTTPLVNATAPSGEFGIIYGIAGAIVVVSLALLSLVVLYVTRYGKRQDQAPQGKQAGGKRIKTRTIAQTEHDTSAGTPRTRTAEIVDITKIRTSLLADTDIDPFVLEAAIAVAIELSREGREGKPIGTAFVIGDNVEVLMKSRQLILNPLEGHPREERLIVRPDLREYIKEMALLDGAFVISGDGVIEAAGRYITVDTSNVTIPQGLGTRHASIAAITKVTRAVGIVVSESGGTITFFKNGEIVGTIR